MVESLQIGNASKLRTALPNYVFIRVTNEKTKTQESKWLTQGHVGDT